MYPVSQCTVSGAQFLYGFCGSNLYKIEKKIAPPAGRQLRAASPNMEIGPGPPPKVEIGVLPLKISLRLGSKKNHDIGRGCAGINIINISFSSSPRAQCAYSCSGGLAAHIGFYPLPGLKSRTERAISVSRSLCRNDTHGGPSKRWKFRRSLHTRSLQNDTHGGPFRLCE